MSMFRNCEQRCGSALPPKPARRGRRRPGLTLVELLIAMSIMVMVIGTLGAVAKGVQDAFEYAEGHEAVMQHARLVLDEVSNTVREAAANELFPGVYVLSEEVDSWRFPDTLVVWHTSEPPVGTDGSPRSPRYDELVVYCPHPEAPGTLVKITTAMAGNLPEDPATWPARIDDIKRSPASTLVALTSLMRTATVLDPETDTAIERGAIRFERRLSPSEGEWEEYRNGERNWDELSWVQGIYGPKFGLRQAWVRMELQLVPGKRPAATDTAGHRPIPFFGSSSLYYVMRNE